MTGRQIELLILGLSELAQSGCIVRPSKWGCWHLAEHAPFFRGRSGVPEIVALSSVVMPYVLGFGRLPIFTWDTTSEP
jgi:hypothetical protein